MNPNLHLRQDTICALATGMGGGIAVIRISGTRSIDLWQKFVQTSSGENHSSLPTPRKAYFGTFVADRELIDEIVATYYQAPHSYTGEDVVEISCHASIYIVRKILESLTQSGVCRMAQAGEFTQRAFINGKMDLVRAEAVADLIASETQQQHKMAMEQLRGQLSNNLNELRHKLLHLTALLELELDFSQEDVEFVDRSELIQLTHEVENKISRLIQSFSSGNSIKKGIPVAIVGATNVGKSTLLNALLQEDRAIVSDIHGTTRDTVEDTLSINGILFRMVDTAGFRDTIDPIENLGIQRSLQKIEQAQIVLRVWDAIELNAQQEAGKSFLPETVAVPSSSNDVIDLVNKIDLIDEDAVLRLTSWLKQSGAREVISISGKERKGIEGLELSLLNKANRLTQNNTSELLLSNTRHLTALLSAQEGLNRVLFGMQQGLSMELLTPDLRLCIDSLGEITGDTITGDNVLHHIFQNFCIGK